MEVKRYLPILILSGLVILVQLALTLFQATFYLKELTQSAYYILVVLGLCLLMGYAGQISLGHAGFFAIGGYTSALLTTYNFGVHASWSFIPFLKTMGVLVARQDLYGQSLLTFAPWPAFLIALLLTALIAFLIGAPVIRLKGHYLAMATLGFGVIILTIINATPLLGEYDPLTNVPPFPLLPGLEVNGRQPFRLQNYYIAWSIVIITLVFSINLIRSRVGRALRSIHGNEEAANALGVDTTRYKLYTFVLSALLASMAGIFFTHYNGSIGPSEVTVTKSVRYVAIVAVGGMANLWGCLLMGILLNFLSLRGYLGSFDDLFFGIILILIMLFAPQGVLNVTNLQRWLLKLRLLLKIPEIKLFKSVRKGREKKANL
jgi:branched-chain amino acid transport system permease protein